MRREPGIKWLFMDLNSYFASVEQQEQPHLRGKPVAVVPMETEHTCAIAASYEAKAYGIKTGTIIRDARRMCPHLLCTLARHDVYVRYHHLILEEVIKHTPINKVWSIDELSSRLPPSKRNIDDAATIAQNIKRGLWEHVGEAINCSIGIAPNSFLAKVAGEMKKPDGLVVLTQEDLPGPLLDLKLTDLPGIGKNMEKRLYRANITTMDALWRLSPKHMRRIWGAVQGERFWYMLHGYDVEPPATETSMVGHSRVLDPDLRLPHKARMIARKLAFRAAQRLCGKGFLARRIRLSARTPYGLKWSKDLAIPPTDTALTLLDHLGYLWDQLMDDLTQAHSPEYGRLKLKSVSVIYSDLIAPNLATDDLLSFHDAKAQEKQSKHKGLQDAITTLQHKYQKDIVSFGITPKTSAGYVGTKIAFSRVPEKEEFWQ